MRKKMIIKIISWIIFIGLVIALIVGAINIYMVTTTSKRIISVDDAKDINADCIIVLGAGVKPSGKPSWMLEDRIIVGEQLYNVNAAPKLLMSGLPEGLTHAPKTIMQSAFMSLASSTEIILFDVVVTI